MALVRETRMIGLILCALISVAAIVTLVRHYKQGDAPPLLVNGVVMLLVAIALG